ncbi:pyrroline-5-carboxylate reductase family protein [Phenylobacterium deserti]|uniref:Pyrroline-5-carboxylate reductase n=1 Tax=Phenylobacterium deserti TaxID=1914756 RepID=A0A328A9Z8_9CAUL|nr:pyrroline-5-carboxylate reductase dimerization domain-containing protein [Phenylobacterium deserti]RAK51369.1 pyrroline-5-carboxylate reductase [Phenylobacterium deserti]
MTARLLIGAGAMGGAMLDGWAAEGRSDLHLWDRRAADRAGVARLTAIADAAALPRPLAVVLAVKPQAAPEVLAALRSQLRPGDLVVSVMAGVGLAALRRGLGEGPDLVRAMPNLAAALGRAVVALSASPALPLARRAEAMALLRALGALVWVEESEMDAATALCGSGPAYFFRLAELMAQAGEAAGLPATAARQLAAGALISAGALAQTADVADARRAVTSPGGATAAALARFDHEGRLAALTAEAVAAAAERAAELARELETLTP